jgi:glycosyltransferase involved in cell wall biosynthesis
MFYVISQVIIHHFIRKRFDLIHVHSIPAMMSGKILSSILKIPIVVTIHGAWMKNWMEKFVLTGVRYDAQITVSRNFLQFPNVNKNIAYIPNGVDLDVFKGPALPRQGRALSDQKTKVILFVGRKNDPVKGFSILERALELVKQEIPQIELLVAGGDLPPEDVLHMYRKADLFVLPSLSEGFPLTLLEAWAAKLPVVATKVGELPYLITEGTSGYLVEPGNYESLAEGIVRAFKNKHLAKLGENGYNLAKRYTWKNVAQKTVYAYRKVCSIS